GLGQDLARERVRQVVARAGALGQAAGFGDGEQGEAEAAWPIEAVRRAGTSPVSAAVVVLAADRTGGHLSFLDPLVGGIESVKYPIHLGAAWGVDVLEDQDQLCGAFRDIRPLQWG